MAKAKTMKEKTDKRYRAAVVVGKDPSGREIKKWVSAKTKKELEAKKKQLLDRFIAGYDVADMTVRDYVKLYLPNRIIGVKRGTVDGILTTLNAHIIPAIGSRYIASVTSADLAEIVATMQDKGLCKAYVDKAVREMKMLFASAMAKGVLRIDPAHDLRAPRMDSNAKTKRALTETERKAILEVGRTHPDGLFLLLMYYLGLRISETVAVKWQDIDFEKHEIKISRQLDINGRETTTKTESSVRTIPIPDALYAILRGKRGVGYIILNRKGKTLTGTRRGLLFKELMGECAGAANSCLGLTSHYLRHNYATMCYNAGVPAKTLQGWMGHTSITTTLDIYAHLDAEREKTAAALLENVF